MTVLLKLCVQLGIIYIRKLHNVLGTATMAKPIELGLVLEGEDAKEFFRNERNPVVSKELIGLFRRGKKIYEQNRF